MELHPGGSLHEYSTPSAFVSRHSRLFIVSPIGLSPPIFLIFPSSHGARPRSSALQGTASPHLLWGALGLPSAWHCSATVPMVPQSLPEQPSLIACQPSACDSLHIWALHIALFSYPSCCPLALAAPMCRANRLCCEALLLRRWPGRFPGPTTPSQPLEATAHNTEAYGTGTQRRHTGWGKAWGKAV